MTAYSRGNQPNLREVSEEISADFAEEESLIVRREGEIRIERVEGLVGVGGDASSVISSSYEDTSPIMGALTS